jgi:hypothetical protein
MTVSAVGCVPEETIYFQALPRLRTWSLDGGALRLEGDGVRIIFGGLPPQPIEAARERMWTLRGAEGLEGPVAVTGLPTLYLRADGGIAIDTGCFSSEGRYVVAPDEIEVVEAHALGQCAAPRPQDLLMSRALEYFAMSFVGDRLIVVGRGAILTF